MVIKHIIDLFHSLPLGKYGHIEPIPQAGSARSYFRVYTTSETYIATYSDNVKENKSFIYFSGIFANAGLPVPKVLGCNADGTAYIQTDAGKTSLLDTVLAESDRNAVKSYYQKALAHLIDFQLQGGRIADFSNCVREDRFSKRLIMADLNYFKYYFLKLSGLPVEEHLFDEDCYRFAKKIEHTDDKQFMYRDFQARNIIINGDAMQFIDFQGGMSGPLQYDVASLLYQARAGLSAQERKDLLDFYMEKLAEVKIFDRDQFCHRFYTIVFVRILQTLGAYGFRGFIERKSHFIQSIKPALENLQQLLPLLHEVKHYQELYRVTNSITQPENIEMICKRLH